jgi:hypothetical protein
MFELGWLLRAKRWAENPPSSRTVLLILGLILFCLLIAAVERWIGWPDWMSLEPASRRGLMR